MNRRLLIPLLLVTAVAALATLTLAFGTGRSGDPALAEFSVQNLSCGSCVQNIQGALADVEGIGKVEVSVTAARARVEYDPAQVEADAIAARITATGYPATPLQLLSVSEYRSLREDVSQLAERFVGRVGERLVSREAFSAELSALEGELPPQGLLKSVWDGIVQRELLLAAAEQNGVVVQPGEVDLELTRLREANSDFVSDVERRYGGEDAFRLRLKQEMTIQRNIDENVLKGANDAAGRRARLDGWFRELAATVPVLIFDPALKSAVETGGKGCGGKCCG